MSKVIIYEKPTCTTCRKMNKLLDEMKIEHEKVNYFSDPFTRDNLTDLLKKMDMNPSELLRKNEKAYKELDFNNKHYSEDDILSIYRNSIDELLDDLPQLLVFAIRARIIQEQYN